MSKENAMGAEDAYRVIGGAAQNWSILKRIDTVQLITRIKTALRVIAEEGKKQKRKGKKTCTLASVGFLRGP